MFDSVNALLQTAKPCIHVLRAQLLSLLTNIFICFVTPEATQKSTSVENVNVNEAKNIKKNKDLVIGAATKQFINSQLSAGALSQKEIDKFYCCVHHYYGAAYTYICYKFPLNDDWLQHAEVVDI